MSQKAMLKLPEQPEQYITRFNTDDDRKTFLTGCVADPLRYFVPTGAGDTMIRALVKSSSESAQPTILCTYANRTGKDFTATNIIMNLAMKTGNGWFDYDFFNGQFPFPRKVLYVSEPDILKNEIIPNIEKMLEGKVLGQDYTKEKMGKSYYSRFKFLRSGFELLIKSYDDNPKSFEGATLGLIILSEPCPEVIWKKLKGRRALGCMMLLVMTPLETDPYVFDEVGKKALAKVPGYYWLTANLFSACKDRGTRGYIEAETINGFIKDIDPAEVEARVYGKIMYFKTAIYKGLNADLHFVSPNEYPVEKSDILIHSVDPADSSRENAEVWIALKPNGRRIIFAELPDDESPIPFWERNKQQSISKNIEQVKFKEMELFEELGRIFTPVRIMDRHFGTQSRGGNEKTFIKEYRSFERAADSRLYFLESYKAPGQWPEIAFGHNKITELLRLLPDGKPGLVIWNTCKHTWTGLTHYIQRHKNTRADSETALGTGKPIEKQKDFPDATRYGCCYSIPFLDTEEEKEDYKTKIARKKAEIHDPLDHL